MRTSATSGFTIIEVLLSITLVAIVMGIGIPVYLSLQNNNAVEVTSMTFAQGLRRAETLARAVEGDSTWGAYIQTGSVTVFKGDSFSSRDESADEIYDTSGAAAVSGVNEYVFSKLTGYPSATGTTILSDTTGDRRVITVNEKGTVNF